MFKIAENPTYKWPVTVQVPKDGGKFVPATFTAELKALGQGDIDRAIAAASNGDDNADILLEVLVGWSGVQDADGTELPYSEEARAKLLDIPYVRRALVAAFFDSITSSGARRKN